jgi:hypothetical protein
MSNVDIEELLSPYEGPNSAHKAFRQEFKYLNALYYLIASAKDRLQEHLQRAMANAEAAAAARGRDGKYALGIVTHAISASQFQGVCVPKSDAEAMVQNFDGFIDLVSRHCVIAAHRAIIDFATDLLLELEQRSLISIAPTVQANLHQRRLRPAELAKQFTQIGEPIHTDPNELQRLHLLGETRNLLEHNDGRATKEYVQLVGDPTLTVGYLVRITGKEVGEAFALIQSTAASLNRRILERFNV